MSEKILQKRSELLELILEDGLEKSLIGIKLIDEKNGSNMNELHTEEIRVHVKNYHHFLGLSNKAEYKFDKIKEKYTELIEKYKLN